MNERSIQFIKRLLPLPIKDLLRRIRAQWDFTSARLVSKAIGNVDPKWRSRIDDAKASPDNAKIPRCPAAGIVDGYTITMHNGVRVSANGYYGSGILNLLIENKGVHEPQEEYAFETIVRLLPEKCVMLELGAYWGFYSLSLLKQRPKSVCYLVEPETRNIRSGKINFRLNKRKGVFTQARVDRLPKKNPKTISVDSFCNEHGIHHINILHADIQGYELAMLEGADFSLSSGKIDFVFISTHSNELHSDCIETLKSHRYDILAEADLIETFSFDGLIVAKHQSISEPRRIEISKKSTQRHNPIGK